MSKFFERIITALYEQSRTSIFWSLSISLFVSIFVTFAATKPLKVIFELTNKYVDKRYSFLSEFEVILSSYFLWYVAISTLVFLVLMSTHRIVAKVENGEVNIDDNYGLISLTNSLGVWVTEGRIQKVIKEKLPWCESLFVVQFGSRAEGSHRSSSDIDYCFFLNGSAEKGLEHYALSKYRGRKPFFDIDFVEYSTALREVALGSPFYHHIAHGQLVLGKENQFNAFKIVAYRISVAKNDLLIFMEEKKRKQKIFI